MPELEERECICVEIPMIHDRKKLNEAYDQAADLVEERLRRGQKAAFLNLGDVTLYATYLHVHRRIQKRGFQAELINGIPSFAQQRRPLERVWPRDMSSFIFWQSRGR